MRSQNYDPFGSMALSALMAVIPVIVLLGAVEIFEARALMGLFVALLIAVFALDLLPATGASILIAAILIRLIPRLQRVGTRPDVCENTVSHSLFVFGDLLRGGDLLHYKIRRYGRGLGLALAIVGSLYNVAIFLAAMLLANSFSVRAHSETIINVETALISHQDVGGRLRPLT